MLRDLPENTYDLVTSQYKAKKPSSTKIQTNIGVEEYNGWNNSIELQQQNKQKNQWARRLIEIIQSEEQKA